MTEVEHGTTGISVPDAEELAESINSHGREKAYDQVIVGYLLQIADELSEQGGGETDFPEACEIGSRRSSRT